MPTPRPNVLVVMTDQERYPMPYEGAAVAEFRRTRLPGHRWMRERGSELHRHHTSATACLPSRTSLFCGQYPSLHGVTVTDGLAKTADDPAMTWLDPDTVPTMGDWFRAAGYRTYYRGKWHLSHADLRDAVSGAGLATSDRDGRVDPDAVDRYLRADRLDGFGFGGWVGREPHGADPADGGLARDPIFLAQMLELFDHLESDAEDVPWMAVASFVNPHDIVFSGAAWPVLQLEAPDPTVPVPDAAPSQTDTFDGRPRAQAQFRDVWPAMLYEQPTDEAYRHLYLWLHEVVDRYVHALLERLAASRFADDTIVVFTSDHGEMLGAHGGMQQKFHTAFDEAIRVPLLITGPGIPAGRSAPDVPTTHVDVLPTVLGLAGLDPEPLAARLAETHIEVHPLVGRDLTPLLTGAGAPDGPVYFMTEDRVSLGLRRRNILTGEPVTPVEEPSCVEAVVGRVDGRLWKLTHYYEELIDWRHARGLPTRPGVAADEWELYDLTSDPEERCNLAASDDHRDESATVQRLLESERDRVRTVPASRNRAPVRVAGGS